MANCKNFFPRRGSYDQSEKTSKGCRKLISICFVYESDEDCGVGIQSIKLSEN